MSMQRRDFLKAGLGVLAVRHAWAAEPFPTQAVRIVVASTPGTVMDTSARLAGRQLEPAWRQPVVIMHQPGAGGAIGTETVAKAKPDGHTLLVAHEGIMAIQPVLAKAGGPRADVRAVCVLVEVDLLLIVNRASGLRTVAELIAESRKRRLTYASAGPGTPVHLRMEMLKQQAGIDLVHVPYKSTAAGMTDLVGGHVDCMLVSVGPALPHLAEKLNVLATAGTKRHTVLPNVPALSETLPGFAFSTWFGLFAPAETPREVVELIARDVTAALQSDTVRAPLREQAINAVGGTPEQLDAVVRADFAAYSKLINSGKLKLS